MNVFAYAMAYRLMRVRQIVISGVLVGIHLHAIRNAVCDEPLQNDLAG